MTITDTEQVPEAGGRRRRGGGAEGRRALRQASRVDHLPFIRRKLAVYEVLDEEGLSIIEGNADLILEQVCGRESGLISTSGSFPLYRVSDRPCRVSAPPASADIP